MVVGGCSGVEDGNWRCKKALMNDGEKVGSGGLC